MRAVTIGAVVVFLGTAGLAQAEGNTRYNGKYLISGAKHMVRADNGKGISARQKPVPYFNPKELSIDKPVPWQKALKNSFRQMKSRSPHLHD